MDENYVDIKVEATILEIDEPISSKDMNRSSDHQYLQDCNSGDKHHDRTKSTNLNIINVKTLCHSRTDCPHCSLEIKSEQNLLKHIQLHHNRTTKRNAYHCHICSTIAENELALELHILNDHGIITYKCNQCFYVIYKLEDLIEHLTLRHSEASSINMHQALSLMKTSACSCLINKLEKIISNDASHQLQNSFLSENNEKSLPTKGSSKEFLHPSQVQDKQPISSCNADSNPVIIPLPSGEECRQEDTVEAEFNETNNSFHSLFNGIDNTVSARTSLKRSKKNDDNNCPSKFMKVDFLEGSPFPEDESCDTSSVDLELEFLKDILPTVTSSSLFSKAGGNSGGGMSLTDSSILQLPPEQLYKNLIDKMDSCHRLMVGMSRGLAQLTQMQHDMRCDVRHLHLGSMNNGANVDSDLLSRLPSFPLTSLEQVDQLEDILVDKQQRNILINELSRLGGSRPTYAVYNVVHFVMSKPVAVNYSLKGRKMKKPFMELKLYSCVIEALKQSPMCREMTTHDMDQAIALCLVSSRDRSSRVRPNRPNRLQQQNMMPGQQDDNQNMMPCQQEESLPDNQNMMPCQQEESLPT